MCALCVQAGRNSCNPCHGLIPFLSRLHADGEDDSGADTRPHSRATSAEPPALPGADGEQDEEQGGEEREDEDGKGVPRLAVKGEEGEGEEGEGAAGADGEGTERAARAAATKRKSVSFAEPMDVDGEGDGGAGVRVKEEQEEDGGWVRVVGWRSGAGHGLVRGSMCHSVVVPCEGTEGKWAGGYRGPGWPGVYDVWAPGYAKAGAPVAHKGIAS